MTTTGHFPLKFGLFLTDRGIERVMDRPTRRVALGGVSVEVGAVCQAVADHLAASRDLRPSVWLERGGRLRRVASTGAWSRRDGISATAGVVGATFTSGVETVVPDLAGSGEAARVAGDGAGAQAPAAAVGAAAAGRAAEAPRTAASAARE